MSNGLLLAVADAGQMRHEGNGAGLQNVGEHVLGRIGPLLGHAHAGRDVAPARCRLRRTPLMTPVAVASCGVGDEGGAVGHRDEVGSSGKKPVNAAPCGRGGLTRTWREELQADGGQRPDGRARRYSGRHRSSLPRRLAHQWARCLAHRLHRSWLKHPRTGLLRRHGARSLGRSGWSSVSNHDCFPPSPASHIARTAPLSRRPGSHPISPSRPAVLAGPSSSPRC